VGGQMLDNAADADAAGIGDDQVVFAAGGPAGSADLMSAGPEAGAPRTGCRRGAQD
jgi:hypothetical protein